MPTSDDETTVAPLQENMRKPNLTSQERRDIVQALLLMVVPGDPELKLMVGAIKSLSDTYHVDRKTIRNIWQRAVANFFDPNIKSLISSPKKKGNSGRPQKWVRQDVRDAVSSLPLNKRRTIRSIASALEIPKSTLFEMKNDMEDVVIMPKSLALKPMLTELHKVQRMLFATSKLNQVNNQFHPFYDSIHIDEKWFFISEKTLRVYCVPGEVVPERYCQNKDHLIKVMFLCAIARPRYNNAGTCIFDGKIGMWPFVETRIARRTSRNRAAGTPETKVINCDKVTYRRFLIDKVIPAIRMKWPDRGMNRTVIVQHDGASAHIEENDQEFNQAAKQGVWNICLETQPAKSPDTNVLDLSFFRALQAKQWSLGSETTIDGLIAQVLRAFMEFEPRKIDCGFLTLQTCLNDMMEVNGGNDYQIRHLGKQALLREFGSIPRSFRATDEALQVYQLFTGDGGEIYDSGDDNSDAGAGDGAVEQMIMPMEAV